MCLAADGITADLAADHKPLTDSELASDLGSDLAAGKIAASLAVDHEIWFKLLEHQSSPHL